jgi:hypothetical protein
MVRLFVDIDADFTDTYTRDDVDSDMQIIKSEIHSQFKTTVKIAQYETPTRYSAHIVANLVVDLEI